MGTTTTNYSLYKPDGTEFVDEDTDLNNNYDIIDTEIKARADEIADLTAVVDVIDDDVTAVISPPTCKLQVNNTVQLINSGSTGERITWYEKPYESAANIATDSAPNWIGFTIPEDGIYYLDVQLSFEADINHNGTRSIFIKVNGVNVGRGRSVPAESGSADDVVIWSNDLALNAADEVEIWGATGGTADLHLSGVGYQNYATLRYVRPLVV